MKVAVLGLGYAGMVSAACLASKGHDVWGVDVDASKSRLVNDGASPVVEPGLDVLISDAVRRGTLRATTDIDAAVDGADIVLVCVGTPATDHGRVDLRQVEAAVSDIGRAFRTTAPPPRGRRSVVIRSTVPPGTVEELVRPTLARFAPAGCSYGVAMVPEFLREGSGVSDFFAPPFTVIGTDDALVGSDVAELFSGFDARVHIVATRTAEALKYACNAFHATKVSFANEIARLFRGMGIDSRVVMELFCEDDQLNISPAYLRPGFAFGGSCLPKDLRALLYLARVNSVDLPMLSATLESNEITISDVVDRIIAHGGRNVAVLGLSFKMETDDLRESPNVILCETLLGKGYNIRIYDPIVKPARLIGTNQSYVESKLSHLQRLLTDSVGDALAGADVAVVSSRDPLVVAALVATPPPLVVDISGRLGPQVERVPGYWGIGW
ncbi:MAG: nucleotide sugar dehydrogenase [Acidimicrobiia bacterium]